jgi:hypothetical protein
LHADTDAGMSALPEVEVGVAVISGGTRTMEYPSASDRPTAYLSLIKSVRRIDVAVDAQGRAMDSEFFVFTLL